MSWYADQIEFEREIVSRDGEKAKVWLRPASAADIIAIGDTDEITDTDLYVRQIIRWELPDPATAETINRLDITISRQLQEIVNEINSAEPGKRKEPAAADPTKPPSGSSEEPNAKRPELVAS